jgi:tRNA dimethylallyltransferase
MAEKPLAILLMGPTASGKSALALELAQALPLEIVSVDSAQVYRGMDIGTAKPDAATLARFPHHLVDLVDPIERYSAARFRNDALGAMEAITRTGRIPLLVGGTMLYFKALREGLSLLPEASAELRAQIDEEASRDGWPALHAQLAAVDPDAARRIEPTDSQRIQRALEIYRLTGRAMSSLLSEASAIDAGREAYRYLPLALVPSDRALLHERIARRFAAMLDAGLVEELSELRRQHALSADLPAMRCVGYRQAWAHLEGEYGFAELRDRGIYATRQLAKRQLTWIRHGDAEASDCFASDLAAALAARIERALESR